MDKVFRRKGTAAPNLLRLGFPMSFSLLVFKCSWSSCPLERTREAVVGYVPIIARVDVRRVASVTAVEGFVSAYSLDSSRLKCSPGVAAA